MKPEKIKVFDLITEWPRPKLSNKQIKAICEAYQILNSIRAAHGTYGSWDAEYFSNVVDKLSQVIKDETGKPAHCHPTLYDKNLN